MQLTTQTSISHRSAQDLMAAAVMAAEQMGVHISACVVDTQGRVKAQVVMDQTAIIADDLVVKKARTGLLGLSSADFAEAVAQSPEVSQSMLQLQQITLLGGGFPLKHNGTLVGAFAVGGASLDQDISCAEQALKECGLL